MSLTTLLKNDYKVRSLFNTIPDIRHLFKSYGATDVYSRRPFGANPALIGTAFDFWLRAYIQKENNKLIEKDLSLVIDASIKRLGRILTNKEWKKADRLARQLWIRRVDYITGGKVDLNQILIDSIKLAELESVYRSRNNGNNSFLRSTDVNHADIEDLAKLARYTQDNIRLFKTNKEIYLNPIFHRYSLLVGGADADLVIGNTLIDIKTSGKMNYNAEFVHQLIGYYLLSLYDEKFPTTIKQVGLYYARYCRYLILRIEDLQNVFNLRKLENAFKRIIEAR